MPDDVFPCGKPRRKRARWTRLWQFVPWAVCIGCMAWFVWMVFQR